MAWLSPFLVGKVICTPGPMRATTSETVRHIRHCRAGHEADTHCSGQTGVPGSPLGLHQPYRLQTPISTALKQLGEQCVRKPWGLPPGVAKNNPSWGSAARMGCSMEPGCGDPSLEIMAQSP